MEWLMRRRRKGESSVRKASRSWKWSTTSPTAKQSSRRDSGKMLVICDLEKSWFLFVAETKGQLKWRESRRGGEEEKAWS